MAGYSSTPLPKKLGIKHYSLIAMLGVPADVRAELKDAIATCDLSGKGRRPLDFVLLFVKTQAKLKNEFSRVAQQIGAGWYVVGGVAEEGFRHTFRSQRKRSAPHWIGDRPG